MKEDAQDEYIEAPWERPCPEPFEWDGNRDVMVLADPASSQRGWCQGRVVKDTAKTLHFSWPGDAHSIQQCSYGDLFCLLTSLLPGTPGHDRAWCTTFRS